MSYKCENSIIVKRVASYGHSDIYVPLAHSTCTLSSRSPYIYDHLKLYADDNYTNEVSTKLNNAYRVVLQKSTTLSL